MLLEILSRTPPWVFVLFIVLLTLGIAQSRPRSVARARLVILPLAMISLSIYGVFAAFQASPIAMLAWLAGVGIALLSNRALAYPRGVRYEPETRSFSMPGSWLPLALMMMIFFTRYAVAVALVRNPSLAETTQFIGGVSLVYGCLSGMFFAGALSTWRLANRRSGGITVTQ